MVKSVPVEARVRSRPTSSSTTSLSSATSSAANSRRGSATTSQNSSATSSPHTSTRSTTTPSRQSPTLEASTSGSLRAAVKGSSAGTTSTLNSTLTNDAQFPSTSAALTLPSMTYTNLMLLNIDTAAFLEFTGLPFSLNLFNKLSLKSLHYILYFLITVLFPSAPTQSTKKSSSTTSPPIASNVLLHSLFPPQHATTIFQTLPSFLRSFPYDDAASQREFIIHLSTILTTLEKCSANDWTLCIFPATAATSAIVRKSDITLVTSKSMPILYHLSMYTLNTAYQRKWTQHASQLNLEVDPTIEAMPALPTINNVHAADSAKMCEIVRIHTLRLQKIFHSNMSQFENDKQTWQELGKKIEADFHHHTDLLEENEKQIAELTKIDQERARTEVQNDELTQSPWLDNIESMHQQLSELLHRSSSWRSLVNDVTHEKLKPTVFSVSNTRPSLGTNNSFIELLENWNKQLQDVEGALRDAEM